MRSTNNSDRINVSVRIRPFVVEDEIFENQSQTICFPHPKLENRSYNSFKKIENSYVFY